MSKGKAADVKFAFTAQDVQDLFQPDNVREQVSVNKLREYGAVSGLEAIFNSNANSGLDFNNAADLAARTERYGDNLPIIKEPKTFMELVLQNFEDEILRLLCAASAVSLVLGCLTHGIKEGWLEGASILIAVVIIVSVTSINNYMKEKQFRKLNEIASRKSCHVVRNGKLEYVDVTTLLAGDVCEIETGEIMSVDGVVLKSNNLVADESSITGETDPVKKQPVDAEGKCNPFLISGSKVMEGTGRIMCLGVGRNSQYGILKMKIQQDPDPTPLQLKLTILADQIGEIGKYSAFVTFFAMTVHFLYDAVMSGHSFNYFLSYETAEEFVQYFIIAVSIVVVAVPEGLPLAVTIALAYSVGKMKDENNLVRYLQACETMGGANNVCTDKTGTLTKNLMTVTKIFLQGEMRDVNKTFKPNNFSNEKMCETLCHSICINSNANPKISSKGFEQIGNKTECALLELAMNLGYDFRKVREEAEKGNKVLVTHPFSSARKKMTCVYRLGKETKVFTKGAPDFLLDKCSHFVAKGGEIKPMTKEFMSSIQLAISTFASDSLRNILLTYKDVANPSQSFLESAPEELEKDLTIIGMVGIKDPLRDEIPNAVELCHSAGVNVRMVTGDNKETAVAIAKEAGILERDWNPKVHPYRVMEGKFFREFVGGLVKEENRDAERVGNLDNFRLVAEQLQVLARSSPEDKYILATGLKQLHNVVAMTGDGTNDAPALKKADIGFAMGIAGTQVAKEAAGIILLDDNFKSIVTAIKYGRNIFECIRKFIQFQLTVNFVAISMAFIGGAVLRESPLNAIQMLWVNLIMDTLASLSLATEPPAEDLLHRKPYSRFESLITPVMWKNIILHAIFQVIILNFLLFKGPETFGIPSSINVPVWNNETGKHYAMFFHTFVLLQLFNELNARKLKNEEVNVFADFFNNPLYVLIGVLEFGGQVLIVQYGGKAVKCVPLSTTEHLLCFLMGSLSLYVGFFIKTMFPANFIISPKEFTCGPIHYQWGSYEDHFEEPESKKED